MPDLSRPAAIGTIAIAATLLGVAAGAAEDPSRAAFEARNGSDRPIACTAQIAHWFSVPVGRAAPGDTVRAELLSDAPTGAVFLENGAGDRLPVEALWCGFEGREWETRSLMPLAKRQGEALVELVVSCEDEGGRLRCR
jgi:hypothetical protein